MAPIIRDTEIDALAGELRRLTGAKSKIEAIRIALRAQLREARLVQPLGDRLARAKALADAMGPSDPGFDSKAFFDEMWEEAADPAPSRYPGADDS